MIAPPRVELHRLPGVHVARRAQVLLSAFVAVAVGLAAGFAEGAESQPKTEARHASHVAWSYDGETGPDHWAHLTADFATCATGAGQSPIDIDAGIPARIGALTGDYVPTVLSVINNGHTIQVNVQPGSEMTFGGKTYALVQFHFHHPSEHQLGGERAAMELHMVHRAADGALAVIGVMMMSGAENAALKPVFDRLPAQPEESRVFENVLIDPAALLPSTGGFFSYSGSLTTPPCSEGVTWIVLAQPVTVSPDQVQRFAALFPMNARPLQALHGRFVLRNQE